MILDRVKVAGVFTGNETLGSIVLGTTVAGYSPLSNGKCVGLIIQGSVLWLGFGTVGNGVFLLETEIFAQGTLLDDAVVLSLPISAAELGQREFVAANIETAVQADWHGKLVEITGTSRSIELNNQVSGLHCLFVNATSSQIQIVPAAGETMNNGAVEVRLPAPYTAAYARRVGVAWIVTGGV